MRKLLSLLSVALVVLFAAGCEMFGGENDKAGVTFEFQNAKTTTTTAEVQVVPSDAEVRYAACIVKALEIKDLADADIMDKLLSAEDIVLGKGPKFLTAKNLSPDTEYVAIAFSLTGSKVARYTLKTEATQEPIPADQFNVEIEVKDITATSAIATATPNGVNRYFFRVITKLELDAMGIYNNDYEVFSYILENPNSNDYIVTGEKTLNCHLNPEMDYLAVAFNVENWEAVYAKEETLKLFRYAFTTPKTEPIDPDSLFIYNNIQTTSYGFSVDVIPARGEESFWTYYVWTKQSYDDTLAKESSNNIVMRSYWALYNLAGEAFIWDFGQFMREYMGQTGSSRITSYEPLKQNTDYVVVLFYMDPNVGSDPTDVYEYNYVAIDIHTAERTLAPAELTVSEPVIVKNNLKYDIQFNVKLSEDAESLRIGTQLWANYDFASYWNPNDWSTIEAFFRYGSQSVSEESLAEAKTADGTTISITGADKGDYVVFFEALNSEYTKTQYAVRVTPDMFANAQ